MDLKKLREILKIVAESDVAEVEIHPVEPLAARGVRKSFQVGDRRGGHQLVVVRHGYIVLAQAEPAFPDPGCGP